jgi:hypothetical protein
MQTLIHELGAITVRSDNGSYMLRAISTVIEAITFLDSVKCYTRTQKCNVAISLKHYNA